MRKILLKILTVGLYAAPLTILLFWKWSIFPYVTAKVFIFQILIELLFGVYVLLAALYPEYRPSLKHGSKKDWLMIALIAFLAVSAVSAALAVNPQRSLWSTQDRAIGLVALLHFFALCVMLRALSREIRWKRYLMVVFWVGVAAALGAFIQPVIPDLFFQIDNTRPGSVMGNPTFLASFLVFTIFIGAWLARFETDARLRWALIAGILCQIGAVALGSTRAAILALVIGAFVLLLLSKRRKAALYLLTGCALLAVVVGLTSSAPIWQSIPGLNRLAHTTLSDTNVDNRLIVWRIALQSFVERPIFGWGPENFEYAFDAHYDPIMLKSGSAATTFDKPHNILLQELSETGIVGFISYIALLILLFQAIRRRGPDDFRSFGLALLSAYLVQNLFIFDTFGSFFMLFVLIAFVSSRSSAGAEAELHAPRRGKAGALIGAGVAIAAMLYLIYLNVIVLYTNRVHYQSLNYFANALFDQGIASFEKGLAIPQPYINALRMNFVQSLSDTTKGHTIANATATIDAAIAAGSQALASDPHNYFNYVTLADARAVFSLVDKRYAPDGEAEIAKALALSPDRQQAYYVLAKLKFIEGNPKAAFIAMKQAEDLNPRVGDPHFYYGLLAYQTGQQKLAIKEFDTARELGRIPQTTEEYRLLAGYYADAERYDIANEYFVGALYRDPTDASTELKYAITLMYMNEPTLAKPLFENVLKQAPEVKASSQWPAIKALMAKSGIPQESL